MFNFQKEVVLNDLSNVEVVQPGHDGTQGEPNIDPKVRFMGGGEYFSKYIVDKMAYRTAPIDGTPFVLTLKVPSNLLGKHVQFLIELGLDGDYRGDYGSALWYFRKPILVDLVLDATASVAAKQIADAIKTVVPDEYKFIKVEKTASSNEIKITGADSYQKVRRIVITTYSADDNGSEEPKEVVNVSAGSIVNGTYFTFTKNNVEFGTYDYMIHNLRLPTYANLRFTSSSAPEMPVKGAKYYQYSFAYCVPRVGFGGMSVAGQTNHSTTLHTFFVKEDLKSQFEEKFTAIGVTFKDMGRDGSHVITVLPDSYASSQDLANAKAVESNTKTINKLKTQHPEI